MCEKKNCRNIAKFVTYVVDVLGTMWIVTVEDSITADTCNITVCSRDRLCAVTRDWNQCNMYNVK